MELRQYLTEKTFNIGKDVDYIYNKFFKKTIMAIKKNKWDGKFLTTSFPSTSLPSVKAKKASEINPVRIVITLSSGGNFYNSMNHSIQLTLNSQIVQMYKAQGDLSGVWVQPNLKKAFDNELTDVKIKGSIYHELSHWLDDTFHGQHITKTSMKASELLHKNMRKKVDKTLKQGHDNVGATSYEINAQIHSIKQLKRKYKKTWDDMTFKDVLELDGGLNAVYVSLKGRELIEWKKKMLSRLNREKLLGKRMKIS